MLSTHGRPLAIAESAAALRNGGVIAYPTEAVWGLGCDPFNEAAVTRLLAIKQRDVAKGLILIAGDRAQFDGLLDWDALPADRLASRRRQLARPQHLDRAGDRARAALDHRRARTASRCASARIRSWSALCESFGGPLVSTSANLAGAAAGVRPRRTRSGAARATRRRQRRRNRRTGGAHGDPRCR